jgi:hypothetical protein
VSTASDRVTLRELDERLARPKGSSFRAFKQRLPELTEGADYWVLNPREHAQALARLREQGRLYASSVNAILLSRATADRLLAALQPQGSGRQPGLSAASLRRAKSGG